MPIHVLLIEDNRPDAFLVTEALRKQQLDVVLHETSDTEAAAAYIERDGKRQCAPSDSRYNGPEPAPGRWLRSAGANSEPMC
jgi:hypothetical protein